MFRLWCEVWNAAETVRYGIVNLTSVTYTRRLDVAGTITLDLPATDPVAVEYMQVGRRIHIYWDRHGKRLITKGVLQQRQQAEGAGAKKTSWGAIDNLIDLQWKNSLRGLIYNDEPIADVVADLVGRVDGWSYDIGSEVTGSTTQRFDGVSILQALATVAKNHGYHFRLDGVDILGFGSFGDEQGIRLMDTMRNYVGMPGYIAQIGQLSIVTEGFEIYNWIEPISGPIDGALTLKRSTQNSPYEIQQVEGPNGGTVYAIMDEDSIATYGRRELVWSPEFLITPVVATTTSLINASDVLYEAAVNHLQRVKDPQYVYRADVVGLKKDVKPGEKVRLVYRGEVLQDFRPVRYIDVDEVVWVLNVNERWGEQGYAVSWDISNVDKQQMDAVDMVARSVMGQVIGRYQRQLNVDRHETTSTDTIGKTSPVEIAFTVQQSTVDVPNCSVKVTRSSGNPYYFAVYLDGEEITGGPWLTDPSTPTSFEINIADVIMELGTIQGDHTLRLECLYGSGDIDTLITLVEVVLPGIGVPADPFGDRSM